ncbi:MAG TPA: RagB/SusD family nutrient uptake outer membrane protein [Cyclobacteriaceae bacterium]|nr:RagB/SusD family nutrient uptake outer membrane protein [Cyclobacteriaceae bacterium]
MKMRIGKYIAVSFAGILLLATACKEELSKVTNVNEPTDVALKSRSGLIALGKGGLYMSMGNYYASVDDQLGPRAGKNLGYFTTVVYGLHEAMGDVIFIPWGNQSYKFADNPTDITLDDNTNVPMPIGASQPYELKLRNDRAYGPSNTFLMEWTQMYFVNNSMNLLLANIDGAEYQDDADNNKRALKAWAYFWKGYVYSRIGSMYVAGVIVDEPNVTNGNFVSNTDILAEATKNFDLAVQQLDAVDDLDTYTGVVGSLIPGYCQAGKGGVPTPDQWKRNINTIKARNILVNKKVADMTPTDWTAISNLVLDGIKASDPVFVVKSIEDFNRSVIDPNFGSAAAYSATEDGQTFYVSERLVQDFRANDLRFLNNIDTMESPIVNLRGRGLGFGTRWFLMDGGAGMKDGATPVITYADLNNYGVTDTYLAGSYEENELMKAEVLIRSGDVDGGVALIDAVRSLQGAGLAPIGSVAADVALEELRSERRIALLFRGLAFYDARRLGVIDDKSKGGGRDNAVILSFDSNSKLLVNTSAFINYNYLSYFDVPQNEIEFNTPTSSSVSTKGPE